MRYWLIITISIMIFFFSTSIYGEDEQTGWKQHDLKFNADKTGFAGLTSHTIIEPKVRSFVELPNIKNASGYSAGWSDGAFSIDTDGDGEADATTRKPSLLAKFELTFEDGAQEPYLAWFYRYNNELADKKDIQLWRWCRSCSWKGKVNGENVEIFDNNGNGLYNDLFVDAIRVGKSEATAPYTGYIILKNTLYECRIDPHGHSFDVRPYAGDIGYLNIGKNFKNPPKKANSPMSFTVETKLSTKRFVVDVSKCKSAPVPVGKYKIDTGILSSRIFVTNGDFEEFEVKKDEETCIEWGGKFSLLSKATCDSSGYLLEWDRSGARRRYKQVKHDMPTLKLSFPIVKGNKGEHYIGNPAHKDLEGNCFADEGVQSFTVKVFDYKKKQVNKGEHIWTRRNNAGYGFGTGYTFEFYQCPFKEFRGVAKVTLSVTSKTFSPAPFTTEVEVELE